MYKPYVIFIMSGRGKSNLADAMEAMTPSQRSKFGTPRFSKNFRGTWNMWIEGWASFASAKRFMDSLYKRVQGKATVKFTVEEIN